jgi:hypothetical protein
MMKNISATDHLKDPREAFSVMVPIEMNLNPMKTYFGLSRGKFLRFIISKRGIEMHQKQSRRFKSLSIGSQLKRDS